MSNEPVAWGMPRSDGQIVDVITPEEHARVEGEYTVPLYTHPPQRKPLTDDEIESLAVKHAPPIDPAFAQHDDFIEFARAVERAHNIGGEA